MTLDVLRENQTLHHIQHSNAGWIHHHSQPGSNVVTLDNSIMNIFISNSLYLIGRQVLNVLQVISRAVAVFDHREAHPLEPISHLIPTSSAAQCSLLSRRLRAPNQSGPQRWPKEQDSIQWKTQEALPQCGIQAQFLSPIYIQCYQDTAKSLFSSEK